MKTYITFKNEVDGLQNVFETVNAEEKIAASSIQSLKKEIKNLNIYNQEIEKVLQQLSLFFSEHTHPLMQKKHAGKRALLILTGKKGLVGGLWHQITNKATEEIGNYDFVIVYGLRGKKFIEEENIKIDKFFSSDSPEGTEESMSDYFFKQFEEGFFSSIDILYPEFISITKYNPKIVPFLPFSFSLEQTEDKSDQILGFPIFEPSKGKVFNHLLNKYIKLFFYKIFSETKLTAFSARTVSMEHARAKTRELIKKSVHNYNKQRHRLITQSQLLNFGAHKKLS